jgi:hypothetical protein
VLTFNAEMWTLTKRNKSKIKMMDINILEVLREKQEKRVKAGKK